MPQRLSKDIDRAWAEAFSRAIVNPKLPPGKGWLTITEVVEKHKINKDRARVLLRGLVASGEFERFDGQQIVGKRVFRAIYYRPKGLKNAV